MPWLADTTTRSCASTLVSPLTSHGPSAGTGVGVGVGPGVGVGAGAGVHRGLAATKPSSFPFVSPSTRFVALDLKATKRPSALIERLASSPLHSF